MKHKKIDLLAILILAPMLLILFSVPKGISMFFIFILIVFIIFFLFVLKYKFREKKYFNAFKKIQNEYLKNPDNLNKYLELGYAAFNIRDFNKAYSVFNKIKSQYPDRPAGYCGLGIVEFENKNYQKAKKYLTKTIELDPNYKIAKDLLKKISLKL